MGPVAEAPRLVPAMTGRSRNESWPDRIPSKLTCPNGGIAFPGEDAAEADGPVDKATHGWYIPYPQLNMLPYQERWRDTAL